MLLDEDMKGDLIMEDEREMFRYGPDPYFVASTVVLLIPEIIGLAINGLNEESIFSKIPYWLLSCMVVSMLASLTTGIAFVNNKNDDGKLKIVPSLVIVLFFCVAYAVAISISFTVFKTSVSPIIALFVGFIGLCSLSFNRKNWVAFFFSSISLVFVSYPFFLI